MELILQGSDPHGWHTEQITTRDDLRAYIHHQCNCGNCGVNVWIDGDLKHTFTKRGIRMLRNVTEEEE